MYSSSILATASIWVNSILPLPPLAVYMLNAFKYCIYGSFDNFNMLYFGISIGITFLTLIVSLKYFLNLVKYLNIFYKTIEVNNMSSPPHVENAVAETNQVNELSRDLDQLITEIKKFKENSAVSFYEIGTRLKFIKSEELFKQKGFSHFSDFLKNYLLLILNLQMRCFINH